MAGQYERVFGAKYDEKLSTTEIAALVRGEIKAAVKSGKLPAAKYSVRTSYYSGGSSIRVQISDLAKGGAAVFEPEYLARGTDFLMGPSVITADDRYVRPSRYLPWVNDAVEQVEEMLRAYNHDGSDTMTDYFDVKFYAHVDVREPEPSTRPANDNRPATISAQEQFLAQAGVL